LGKIDLDARLSAYTRLPFPDNGATVRNALAMRSGIPEFADSFVRRYASRSLDMRFGLDQVLAMLPKQAGKPDQDFEYVNTNYLLLTKIIERVTGHGYAQTLRRDLISKARLPRVFAQAAERPTPPVALPSVEVAGSGAYLPNTALASGTEELQRGRRSEVVAVQ
jgi:D-alanyl-D-alanine carboxypeptidase